MPTRLMKPAQKPTIQAPKNAAEWGRLMTAAIERAMEAKSRLVVGLKEAQAKGQTERFLRRLGIIHMNDLERLFPR
jgi:hypothetical protein